MINIIRIRIQKIEFKNIVKKNSIDRINKKQTEP